MKLTALEIKQQQFEKSLRGYDISEVNAYLNLVSNEWEHMVARIKELEAELDKMDEKLKHYQRVEHALHETLQTAKDNAEHKLVGAKKEARLIVEKAEMEADGIVREASQKRQHIRQSIFRLIDKREEIIGGIQSYLETAQNSLNNFSRDDSDIYTLPNENEEKIHNESPKKTKVKNEQPLPPGSENLDDILDEIE